MREFSVSAKSYGRYCMYVATYFLKPHFSSIYPLVIQLVNAILRSSENSVFPNSSFEIDG